MDASKGGEWVATFVYGPCVPSGRAAFWAELSFVAGKWACPYVFSGGFKVITRVSNENKVAQLV